MAKGRKTGGRRKGSRNKTTVSVKEALTQAFDEMGGVPSLVEWGQANRRDFYAIWGKLIPREMDITSKGESLAALAAAAFGKPDAK